MLKYFTLSMIIRYLAVLFAYVWGGMEIFQQVKQSRQKSGKTNEDRGSLLLIYGAIFLGYALGIPFAFAKYGRINWGAPYLAMTGLLVIFAGGWLRLSAMRTLKQHFTYTVSISEQQELIESGLYRLIRHPAYLGELLIFLGIGLAFANWISLASLVIFPLVAFSARIRVEEKALAGHFGERYAEYCKRSWRLLPWVY